MKKIFLVSAAIAAGFALALVLSFEPVQNAYASSGCYNCASGSSANQCRYHGSDTSEQRKKCESMGCKITGTSSCSTAANVKVIN
jgi:hypothetical protein